MARAKIAITVDEQALAEIDRMVTQGVFPNRSKAIEDALHDRIAKFHRSRLARECAKLDGGKSRHWPKRPMRAKVNGPNTERRGLLG